jgi:hypothetical protein
VTGTERNLKSRRNEEEKVSEKSNSSDEKFSNQTVVIYNHREMRKRSEERQNRSGKKE